MSAARKPVIVRKLNRDWCAGYAEANPQDESPEIELLESSGRILRIGWELIKWVCYVRELSAPGASLTDSEQPERLTRRKFVSRPRIAGLWLRMTLIDGDELECIAANDRTLVDGVGLMLTPPDTRSNTQRIFVPRTSIRELNVVAVIGSGHDAKPKPEGQAVLFEMKKFDLLRATD
jgi:hypothetical protein